MHGGTLETFCNIEKHVANIQKYLRYAKNMTKNKKMIDQLIKLSVCNVETKFTQYSLTHFLKSYFLANDFISLFSTQTKHIKS
jgi:hypothetical protein